MRSRFDNFKMLKAQLKAEFEAFIVDPVFSQEIRWKMFFDAPKELSNTDSSIYHGLDFVKTGPSSYDDWFRIQEYDRNQEIDLTDVVYNLQSIVDSISGKKYIYNKDNYIKMPCFQDPDLISKVKEQILKDNMKSFIYDW